MRDTLLQVIGQTEPSGTEVPPAAPMVYPVSENYQPESTVLAQSGTKESRLWSDVLATAAAYDIARAASLKAGLAYDIAMRLWKVEASK